MAKTLLQSKVNLLIKALEQTKKLNKIEDKPYEVLMQLVKDIDSLVGKPEGKEKTDREPNPNVVSFYKKYFSKENGGDGAGFQGGNEGDGLSGFRG